MTKAKDDEVAVEDTKPADSTKPKAKKAPPSDSERIDHVVAVLKRNGLTLPDELL